MERPFMLQLLAERNIACSANQEISFDSAGIPVLRDVWSGKSRTLAGYDLVVFAGYQKAEDELFDMLVAEHPEVETKQVGDCVAPRGMGNAIRDGFSVGASI